ncbi:hypothetical protein ACMGT0_20250 [Pseudomonas sp. RHF3.3-3]|uniref:Uncharacterized protein n=1 Tax=Pseudomonas asplenii TaxID=53407 RepID=A0A0N0VJU3_9PSED|nr:hypothetical protein [Pseudomonas fuscovaginae]KPA90345.1 hypothetical protein PF66_03153 [Pseudomonas fuscovaginae]
MYAKMATPCQQRLSFAIGVGLHYRPGCCSAKVADQVLYAYLKCGGRNSGMGLKALLYGWITYWVISWLTSLGIFYSDIALDSDLHRWLPVIARAESYFVANGQLDFLKKAAWIYEKDFMLLTCMMVWVCLFCRFSLKGSFLTFFRVSSYRQSWISFAGLLVCAGLISTVIFGPDVGQSTRGIYENQLYRLSVFFGAMHSTLVLPPLVSAIAFSLGSFLDPIKDRTTALRH